MPPEMHPSSLASLISAAVAPVALITASAILLSGFSGKHANIATQMRALTAEYRNSETTDARRQSIRRQLRLFHRRVSAIWAATVFLSFALLSFLVTVLALVFVQRETHISTIGAASIVVGLVFILCAVVLELYETGLARLTVAGELVDVFPAEE
ncbi:MAG: DUF2721 domain-containing protein [Armatimonadetes bacterium]|nr:DUF2721 domain-containing protein [Armatimonadota bacterium]